MAVSTTKAEDKVVINITERFDFSNHNEFRDAYRNEPSNTQFEVNMSNCNFLDSSALGMLLLLREHTEGNSEKVILTGCNNDVKSILEIANFDTLFTLS